MSLFDCFAQITHLIVEAFTASNDDEFDFGHSNLHKIVCPEQVSAIDAYAPEYICNDYSNNDSTIYVNSDSNNDNSISSDVNPDSEYSIFYIDYANNETRHDNSISNDYSTIYIDATNNDSNNDNYNDDDYSAIWTDEDNDIYSTPSTNTTISFKPSNRIDDRNLCNDILPSQWTQGSTAKVPGATIIDCTGRHSKKSKIE